MTRYREICLDLAHRIDAGELRPGDELPAVRELARRWRCTASTVSRAQRQLADARVHPLDAVLTARHYLHGHRVLRLAGSDDPGLDLLLRHLGPAVTPVSAAGSTAGLHAVVRLPGDRERE